MPTSKNKPANLLIALGIMLLIVAVLGVPFTNWGFKTDDWANILHSKFASFDQFKSLFTEGNMERFNHPTGTVEGQGSFLQGLYRPMSFVYYWPQTLFFGTQAYGYFLVTIILHALNAGLFFLILRNFFGITASLLAALFFGFHPSLQNWLGWISAQTYFIELFFLGLIFICFYQWLQTRRWRWYLGAIVLFFLNLLLKEASIILCVWVFLATLVYRSMGHAHILRDAANAAPQDERNRNRNNKNILITAHPEEACKAVSKDMSEHENSVLLSCKASAGFIIAALGYCLIRLNSMPFVASNTTTLGFTLSWQSFITKQISRVMQFLTYLYDIIGLTWLPKGHRLANGCLLLAILIVLAILFFKNGHKKIILFCLISTIMFSWPGLLMHYQPRYMYMALPWIIGALVLLLKPLVSFESIDTARTEEVVRPSRSTGVVLGMSGILKSSGRAVFTSQAPIKLPLTLRKLVRAVSKGILERSLYILAILYIAASAGYVFANMKEREFALHWLDTSMRTLVTENLPAAGWQHEPLCFFGLPTHWFDMGTAQAVWFLDNARVDAYPVYQSGPSLWMPHQNHARAIPRSDKTIVVQKIQYTNVVIELSNTQELELLHCDHSDTTSAGITHYDNNVWFITWDYAHAKFKILGRKQVP